jgi:hypothetical protein
MQIKMLIVPISDTGSAQIELNRFLSDNKILEIEQFFYHNEKGASWCFCVRYLNSGSSLLDPVGDIQRNIRLHLSANPETSFEELEFAFFPNQDEIHEFTAISPRVLEAGLLGSGQILVEGDYSGIVKPWEHFIPIKKDASNFDEVSAAMMDISAVQKMIKNCRDAILSVDELRYKNSTSITLNLIRELALGRGASINRERVRASIEKYNMEMPLKYKLHWGSKKLRAEVANFLAPYPFFLNMVRSAIHLFR